MTGGYLFAGIGGFELASQWVGIEPIWSNEIDNFCCNVLRKNFDHEIIEADIRDCGKGRKYDLKPVDIICGGFPCQPFSHAGKRKGTEDDRYLWPEMLRIIREVKPQWIIGENVAGLLSMENGKTLERICVELEDSGYEVQPYIIPAAGVGAWHRRDRVWILCRRKQINSNTFSTGGARGKYNEANRLGRDKGGENTKILQTISNTISKRLQRRNGRELQERKSKQLAWSGNSQYNERIWQSEPNVGRVANGIPRRVDRIKALGNAIVPQVAFELLKAINNKPLDNE